MKRKYGDRRDWARILASRYAVMALSMEEGGGVVALYQMDAVRDPLWVTLADKWICVADAGHTWLQYYPLDAMGAGASASVDAGRAEHACYTATAMFDAGGQIVQWYFDICRATGMSDAGIPWHDDLYLDIVADPITGRQEVVDADELDDALAVGNISEALYHAAWRETHRIAPLVKQGALPEMRLAAAQRATLLERLGRT